MTAYFSTFSTHSGLCLRIGLIGLAFEYVGVVPGMDAKDILIEIGTYLKA